jgi:hypothetical protein
MTRRSSVTVAAFLAWTLFVWGVVRVRNILGDDALAGGERARALLLSASFWVPAVVLAVLLGVAAVRRQALGRSARIGVMALGVWTTLVWLVRAYGITFLGDHETPFIVVHLVLAVVSVVLAALAARSLRDVAPERSPQTVRS